MRNNRPRIRTPNEHYTVDYPEAIAFAESQARILWTEEEISMEKDIHDLKTNLDPAELHGVIEVLKLFTKYEIHVGVDYWSDRIMKMFPRPDIQRMAATIAYVEMGVHTPFYAKINELLGLATTEFFDSYKENPVLKERMDWIGSLLKPKDDSDLSALQSLSAFCMIEGAVLYSNFAFLKHFQSEGKNKLSALISGINFSVKDENIHSLADAWLFRTLKAEAIECGSITPKELKMLEKNVLKIARKTYEHESEIVKMIFSEGAIKGITANQLDNFVQSRIDLCLENLGYDKIFNPVRNPIKKWFYKGIGEAKMHDFFYAQGSDYNRDWDEKKFIWVPTTS